MWLRALVIGLAGLALGYWVLISPDNPMMRAMRGDVTHLSADVIMGPYPVERDFRALKSAGVRTIVSLLDPNFPYEKQLLEQEQARARDAQIRLLNFPMGSVMGRKLGSYYEQNAQAAARAIGEAAAQGKVYVHCYLGVHRIVVVRNLLAQQRSQISQMQLPPAPRSQAALDQDRAESLFNDRQFAQARQFIERLPARSPALQVLYAWTLYRLGDMGGARQAFMAVSAADLQVERALGLAYVDLRQNHVQQAQQQFARLLVENPDNSAAVTGMGLALYRLGRGSAALPYLERALRTSPGDADVADALRNVQRAAAGASAPQVSRP